MSTMNEKKGMLDIIRHWGTLDDESREEAIRDMREKGLTGDEDIIFSLAKNGFPEMAGEIADESLRTDEEFLTKLEANGLKDLFVGKEN